MELVYQIPKTLLKKLLSEKQYAKLRTLYFRQIIELGLPGYLSALPDFIVLGAMKSGTSSLYNYLSHHPQIIPAADKEIHFFDNNFEKGLNWYRRRFPSIISMSMGNYITGEASPYYLYHPSVPERICKFVPDISLVVLLRDPVDRAISHYWHMVNTGREDLPMEEAFEREEERLKGRDYDSFNRHKYSYLDRGKYAEQIERFRKYFDEKNILVLKSDRLFEETQDAYDEVTDFLNVERHTLDVAKTRNKGDYKRETSQSVRSKLEEYYSDQKNRIEKELGISFE